MVMPRGPFQGNVIRIQGVKEIDDIAVLLIPSEVTTIQISKLYIQHLRQHNHFDQRFTDMNKQTRF